MVFGGLETTSAHTEKGQKMPKYINLERARFEAERYFQSMDEIKEDLDTLFCMLQTEDVAPVRHGRWKCNKPCPVCGEDRFKGLDADIWADWEPPYCPNCGAKMDGE